MAAAPRGIDHLVLSARDLDAAEARFRGLGFTLTPRAHHPFGTSNNLAIFDGNFLELLAITAPEKLPPHASGRFSFGAHTADFLKRREGLSFLVLASEDARRDHAEFVAAGLDTFEPVDFSRGAVQPDGREATMSFTIVFVTDPRMPDAPHFVCQQHTPEHFWHAAYQRHANGARRIAAATLVADRPEEIGDYYRRLIGRDSIAPQAGGLVVTTRRGTIEVVRPEALATRYAGVEAPILEPRPYIAGLSIAVADLGAAQRCLRQGGTPFAAADGALRVAPADAFGAVLEFVQD